MLSDIVFEMSVKTAYAFYLGIEPGRVFKPSAAYAMGNMWCSHGKLLGSPLFRLLQTA